MESCPPEEQSPLTAAPGWRAERCLDDAVHLMFRERGLRSQLIGVCPRPFLRRTRSAIPAGRGLSKAVSA
eukprot:3070546-Alexandrium_andersonii.AAC.1